MDGLLLKSSFSHLSFISTPEEKRIKREWILKQPIQNRYNTNQTVKAESPVIDVNIIQKIQIEDIKSPSEVLEVHLELSGELIPSESVHKWF